MSITGKTRTWVPNWGEPPGTILAEVLADQQLSQSELARQLGRPHKTINEIIHARRAITPSTALQLERALGVSAEVWMNLETHYRLHLARQRRQEEQP